MDFPLKKEYKELILNNPLQKYNSGSKLINILLARYWEEVHIL